MKDRSDGEDVERDVSSYWMTLMTRKDTGNWNRKHQIGLEEAMGLTWKSAGMSEWMDYVHFRISQSSKTCDCGSTDLQKW